MPFLPGMIIAGSVLEPGSKDINCVEVDTPNGVANPAIALLSKTNVTVCGFPTCIGCCYTNSQYHLF
jgi:hypothetical protein